MPDEPITTTGIDTLVAYLKEHGESDTITLGNVLKIDEKIIEQWANILERANIIKISYRIGKMFVAPIAATREESIKLKKEVEVKRDILESKLNTQTMLLNQVADKVEALSKLTTEAEVVFKSKAGTVKAHLDYLSKLEQETNTQFVKIKGQKDQIDKMAGTLEKEIRALEDRAVKVKNFELNASDEEKVIKDLRSKLLFIEESTKQVLVDFNATMAKQRKLVNQVVQSMNIETNAVKDIFEQQEKEFAASRREQLAYKKSAEALKKELAKRREAIISEAERAKQTISVYFVDAQHNMNGVDEKLKEMRDKFGGIAELDKRLFDINNALNDIRKEKESINTELNSISAEMHALDALSAEGTETRSIKLNNMMDKVEKTVPEIDKMKKQTDKMREDIDSMSKK